MQIAGIFFLGKPGSGDKFLLGGYTPLRVLGTLFGRNRKGCIFGVGMAYLCENFSLTVPRILASLSLCLPCEAV
jgi:hypothetical protein